LHQVAISQSQQLVVKFNLGTSSFPFCQPGTYVPVIDVWFDGASGFLKLKHPQTGRIETFELCGAFTSASTHYLILVVDDSATAETATVVLKLASSEQAQTLSHQEFMQIAQEASDVFVQHQLADKIAEYFGAVVPDSTAAAQCRKSLTNELYAGDEVIVPETALPIIALSRFSSDVVVRLQSAHCPSGAEFSIPWVVSVSGQFFALLTYPPELTADDPVVPIVVTKVTDSRTLTTLDWNEVSLLTKRIVQLVSSSRRSELIEFEACFGDIAEKV
jgi:hypothetical protein